MKKTSKIMIFLVVLLMTFSVFGITANAADYDEYAPILYFEGEETCYPVNVSFYIQNSELKNTTIEGDNISYYDANYNIIETYQSEETSLGYTVYYNEYTDGTNTIIQYWMFYVFNPGEHNQHEGDWEMVQITLSDSSPTSVAYSQHYSGQRATWDLVEKEGNHFKVYVSRGSHANYLRPYSGKLGIASDIVGDNGKVIKPDKYTLVDLNSVTWLDFDGLWGKINDINDIITGSAGPQGPQYRIDMNGGTMWEGNSWSSSLLPAISWLFLMEWFLYHFVTILVLVTIIFLAWAIYKIYNRHQKYGLGPRIVSMFYIDGPNLHSIGNILCFVGIIVAIFGLFSTWYTVSADVSALTLETEGMVDIIVFNGMNGMQIYMPTQAGAVPMGSVVFPFALIILIGFIFMVIGTVGLHLSRKLGMKYVLKGVRLMVIAVIIIVALMLIGMFTSGMPFSDVLTAISNNPIGGTYVLQQGFEGITGAVTFQWGLGIGVIYLIIAGIIFLVAGILVIMSKKEFFKPKTPIEKKKSKKKEKEEPEKKEEKPEQGVCPHCGKELREGAKFCPGCGKSI